MVPVYFLPRLKHDINLLLLFTFLRILKQTEKLLELLSFSSNLPSSEQIKWTGCSTY
jgi:hypothetical protein